MLTSREAAATLGAEALAIQRAGSYTAPSGARVDLRPALAACVTATVEYPPTRSVRLPASRSVETQIAVERATVLAVGRRMAGRGPVAALNFAAAGSPGGGFLAGSLAQEESLARSSGLFAALEGREMYAFHRARQDAMYTDYVIYSPGVPVFRTDDGALLEGPWPLSILTCPAVNGAALRRQGLNRDAQIPMAMTARTAKVLAVAADHDVRRLILGAWGCGAFGLDPVMMASIFHDALTGSFRGVFDEIVFAITDRSGDEPTIGAFRRRFERTGR